MTPPHAGICSNTLCDPEQDVHVWKVDEPTNTEVNLKNLDSDIGAEKKQNL